MKKLLLLITILLAGCNSTITTDYKTDIKYEENRVLRIQALLQTSPYCKNVCNEKIIVVDWQLKTAFMAKDIPYIYITKGLLNIMTDSEVAFILGHEYAHHILKHVFNIDLKQKRYQEIESDIYGLLIVYCIDSININEVLNIYEKSSNIIPDGGYNSTHPSFKIRTQHMREAFAKFTKEKECLVK